MDPNLVVGAIRNQDILLLRVVRKREVVSGPAHAEDSAPGTSTLGAARRRRRMHEEAGDEFTFLGENLNAIAAPLANVDKPVIGDVNAVQRGRKLFLVGRRS